MLLEALIAGALAIPVVALGAGRIAILRGRRLRAHLAELAKLGDLAVSEPDLFGRGVNVTGRLDGVEVLVERATAAEAGSGLALILDVGASIPGDLEISAPFPEAVNTPTGDPGFDAKVALAASEPVALALSPALRAETIRRVKDQTIRVDSGHVRRRLRIGAPADTLAALRDLAAYARRLELGDLREAIASKIPDEPLVSARLKALRCLVREWPDHPVTAAALDRVARNDPDAGLRLDAALCVPGFAHERASSATVAEVVHALRYGDDFRDRMLECLKGAAPEAAILLELVSRGHPDHDQVVLFHAALARLGEIGDEKTVEHLVAIKSSLELRNAISRAVAAIQSRLPGAGPGQLTIAGDAGAGDLSLAAQDGALSLPSSKKP